MLEVTSFSVQSAGTAAENGPSADRPSGSFSRLRGCVCSATGPPPVPPVPPVPCGLAAPMPPCGLAAPGPACGLAAPGALPGLAASGAEPQSFAGGRPDGDSFLHEVTDASRSTIRAGAQARRSMAGLYLLSRGITGALAPATAADEVAGRAAAEGDRQDLLDAAW